MVLNPSSSLLASQDETKASESDLIHSVLPIKSVRSELILGRMGLLARTCGVPNRATLC